MTVGSMTSSVTRSSPASSVSVSAVGVPEKQQREMLDPLLEEFNIEHIRTHYYWSHTSINPNRIVPIGPDLPFVVIGERINPTGRKTLMAALQEGNLDVVRRDAQAQVDQATRQLALDIRGVPDPQIAAADARRPGAGHGVGLIRRPDFITATAGRGFGR